MKYDEWFEKVGASLWKDAEISTADILRAAWVSATVAEREACAKLCDAEARDCAVAIRARGNSTITVA